MAKLKPEQQFLSTHNSELLINVVLNKQALLNKFDSSLNRVFSSHNAQDPLGKDLSIRKAGKIVLRLSRRSVRCSIPISFEYSKFSFRQFGRVEGSLCLHFRTEIKFRNDKDPEFITQLESYDWTQKARMRMGLINPAVQWLADLVIDRKSKEIGDQISGTIRQQFNYRQRLSDLEMRIQDLDLLKTEPGFGIFLNIKHIGLSEFIEESDRFEFSIFLALESIIRDKPEQSRVSNEINFSWHSADIDISSFHINLNSSYEILNSLVSPKIQNLEFELDSKMVRLDQLTLESREGKANALISLSGDINEELELSFEAFFNRDEQKFKMQDLEIKLRSGNLLKKTAFWIVRNWIQSKLEELMTLEIQEYRTIVQSQLGKIEAYFSDRTNMALDLDLEKIYLENIAFHPAELVLDFKFDLGIRLEMPV